MLLFSRRSAFLLLLSSCSSVNAPPFAVKPYAPFSRSETVAIALREWRLFGSVVDGDPEPDPPPERAPGLWQRVGEYWWIGMDPAEREAGWTGKHDETGREFAEDQGGFYAWSAAFISYVMRIAGAGPGFVYSPNHAAYINAARRGFGVLQAAAAADYAPVPGDLLCAGRGGARGIRFADLPTRDFFPAHCAIVVAAVVGGIDVIGGNVHDSVVRGHVVTSPEGKVGAPWFVVLRVRYEAP